MTKKFIKSISTIEMQQLEANCVIRKAIYYEADDL